MNDGIRDASRTKPHASLQPTRTPSNHQLAVGSNGHRQVKIGELNSSHALHELYELVCPDGYQGGEKYLVAWIQNEFGPDALQPGRVFPLPTPKILESLLAPQNFTGEDLSRAESVIRDGITSQFNRSLRQKIAKDKQASQPQVTKGLQPKQTLNALALSQRLKERIETTNSQKSSSSQPKPKPLSAEEVKVKQIARKRAQLERLIEQTQSDARQEVQAIHTASSKLSDFLTGIDLTSSLLTAFIDLSRLASKPSKAAQSLTPEALKDLSHNATALAPETFDLLEGLSKAYNVSGSKHLIEQALGRVNRPIREELEERIVEILSKRPDSLPKAAGQSIELAQLLWTTTALEVYELQALLQTPSTYTKFLGTVLEGYNQGIANWDSAFEGRQVPDGLMGMISRISAGLAHANFTQAVKNGLDPDFLKRETEATIQQIEARRDATLALLQKHLERLPKEVPRKVTTQEKVAPKPKLR